MHSAKQDKCTPEKGGSYGTTLRPTSADGERRLSSSYPDHSESRLSWTCCQVRAACSVFERSRLCSATQLGFSFCRAGTDATLYTSSVGWSYPYCSSVPDSTHWIRSTEVWGTPERMSQTSHQTPASSVLGTPQKWFLYRRPWHSNRSSSRTNIRKWRNHPVSL